MIDIPFKEEKDHLERFEDPKLSTNTKESSFVFTKAKNQDNLPEKA